MTAMNRRITDRFASIATDTLAAEHATVEEIRARLDDYDRIEAERVARLQWLLEATSRQRLAEHQR